MKYEKKVENDPLEPTKNLADPNLPPNTFNIKINFLNNILNRKKTDSLLSLMEKDVLEKWEECYKDSYVTDYYALL